MTRIYTKSGDDGTTALGSGMRVPKNDPRVEAYGTVDELNAIVGMALAGGADGRIRPMLASIQNRLFDVGADLAFSHHKDEGWQPVRIKPEHIRTLEEWIDRLEGELPPIHNFILPGGSKTASELHLARTVCRRAERLVVNLILHDNTGEWILKYLNRLSDLLFVMARAQNQGENLPDVFWEKK